MSVFESAPTATTGNTWTRPPVSSGAPPCSRPEARARVRTISKGQCTMSMNGRMAGSAATARVRVS